MEYFYGIKDIKVKYNGEWSDPSIIYEGYVLNYYSVIEGLEEIFDDIKDCIKSYANFEDFIQDNEYIVYDELDNYIDFCLENDMELERWE